MQARAEIAGLTGDQTDRAAEMLGRAFFDDPLCVFMLPDDEARRPIMTPFMRVSIALGQLCGRCDTTASTIEGVAVWIPPGVQFTQQDVDAAGGGSVRTYLPADAIERLSLVMARFGELHRRDMPDPHWYLMDLGVEPARQGMGIGGQLVAPVLAEADAAGVPCYLETCKPRNVPFYRRHGFEVIVEEDVPGNGPRIWTMSRMPSP